jgi:hypothetical protein
MVWGWSLERMIARLFFAISAEPPPRFIAAFLALGFLAAAHGAGSQAAPALCLASGDGYLRAHLAGAIDADIDWPNSGTHCEGESRASPVGVRLSFSRTGGSNPDLLFVFGISGVRAAESAHTLGVNMTVFVQGTSDVYATQGDARCAIDSLTQRPLGPAGTYRLEARGFCTQPAHAVHGSGLLLVSRFDFAGTVSYIRDDDAK